MTPEREAELREAHRLMPSPMSTELFAEIDRLRAELGALKAADNPEFDATDGAHPAWWRGHDYVSARFKEELDESEVELDELHDLVEKQSAILTGVANALKGTPPDLMSHSHHDLADVAKQVVKERDDLKAKLDAELPAMWREGIQSLNGCLERLDEELRDVRRERDDIKADFGSLEYDAAKVVRALDDLPEDLRAAVETLRDNGRDGWWER
jgi:chromosome segregation ATPase